MKNVETISKLASIFYAQAGGKQFRKQFDKNILSSPSAHVDNLRTYLTSLGYRLIGNGGSREVYLISSKKVLKLAVNAFGIKQNQLEYETLHGKKSNFLPKVYGRADNYRWIEVETVRPLKNWDEFTSITGLDRHTFTSMLFSSRMAHYSIEIWLSRTLDKLFTEYSWASNLKPEDALFQKTRVMTHIDKYRSLKNNPLVAEMSKDIQQCNIPTEDLDHIDNLGVNSDGHLIFLDVGYRY